MPLKLIQHSFFIVILMTILSCGKSADEKVKDGIDSANILLSTKQCQAAIDLLEGLGRQPKNSYYVKALSSAYACRAGYSTTVFFGTDVSKTATPAPMGGMTTYTTSTSPSSGALANDAAFKDLQTAIDLLLYAGGISSTTEPSASERAKYFDLNHAGDINAQLAYMELVQLGRLMKVYGNASSTGVKGGGSAGNTCFTDYSAAGVPAAVKTYVQSGSGTGACTSTTSSHPELAVGVTGRRARLCQGVVLLNSILDVLPNVIATAGGGDLDDISDMTTDINDAKAVLTTADPSIGLTLTVMSQENCENDSTITEDTLSSYYAVLFESLIL